MLGCPLKLEPRPRVPALHHLDVGLLSPWAERLLGFGLLVLAGLWGLTFSRGDGKHKQGQRRHAEQHDHQHDRRHDGC